MNRNIFNSLSPNTTKWSNTPKQFFECLAILFGYMVTTSLKILKCPGIFFFVLENPGKKPKYGECPENALEFLIFSSVRNSGSQLAAYF